MNSSFFTDNNGFYSYGPEHYLTLLVATGISAGIILYAKKYLSLRHQKLFGFYLALIVLMTQLSKVFIKMELGIFDRSTDLPLHLCNMMPFLVPIAMLTANRLIWAVLFFWIMGGTFQAFFSPTLRQSFPHYEFFRYWIVHVGLVMLMLYGAIVLRFRLRAKDAVLSALMLNLVALVIYFINIELDANYLYLMAKPPGTTLYTLLGEWPYYIFQLELVLVLIFTIIYLPFYFINKRENLPELVENRL